MALFVGHGKEYVCLFSKRGKKISGARCRSFAPAPAHGVADTATLFLGERLTVGSRRHSGERLRALEQFLQLYVISSSKHWIFDRSSARSANSSEWLWWNRTCIVRYIDIKRWASEEKELTVWSSRSVNISEWLTCDEKEMHRQISINSKQSSRWARRSPDNKLRNFCYLSFEVIIGINFCYKQNYQEETHSSYQCYFDTVKKLNERISSKLKKKPKSIDPSLS